MLNLTKKWQHRLLALCLSASFAVYGGDQYSRELRIVTENLPPFNYRNSDGQMDGVGTQVVQALMAELQMHSEIEVMSWARAYRVALNEPNVLIYSIVRTPSREEQFHWLSDFIVMDFNLYAMPGTSAVNITDIKQMNRHSIGMLRDSSHVDFIRSHKLLGNAIMVEAVSYELLYRMHRRGRFDFLLAPQMYVSYLNKKYQTAATQRPKPVYRIPSDHQRNVYLALSHSTSPALVQRVKQALQSMNQKGTIKTIVTNFTARLESVTDTTNRF